MKRLLIDVGIKYVLLMRWFWNLEDNQKEVDNANEMLQWLLVKRAEQGEKDE